MKHLIMIAAICFQPIISMADPVDSPKTLEWVQKVATILEDRLTNAMNMGEEAILLVVLMESANDFNAVALTGLYCHEARFAAEQGRNYCDWLNRNTLDKDLNSLILRAQEARRQAVLMRSAAASCTQSSQEVSNEETYSLADIIRGNAETVEHDLGDGLASQNFHILSQKIEHAERSFRDTWTLSSQLDNCDRVRLASEAGIEACTKALSAKNWTMVTEALKKALEEAAVIKANAEICQ